MYLEDSRGGWTLDGKVKGELEGRPLFIVFEIIQKAQRTLSATYTAYQYSGTGNWESKVWLRVLPSFFALQAL